MIFRRLGRIVILSGSGFDVVINYQEIIERLVGEGLSFRQGPRLVE